MEDSDRFGKPNGQLESESRVRRVSTEGRGAECGKNFVLSEFQCNDGTDILLLHPALVRYLNVLREHFGVPCRVNSGFRTHAYNSQIGGADDSRHLYGMAADIVFDGVGPQVVADFAEDYGFGGVGRYHDFTHVDVWLEGRRWDNR